MFADQVVDRRRAALIGQVHHLDSGARLEELAGEMGNRRHAKGGQRQLVGIGLGGGDEGGDILDRVVAMVTSTMPMVPICPIGSKSLALSNGTLSFTAFCRVKVEFEEKNSV
jgi:hypothetical protein